MSWAHRCVRRASAAIAEGHRVEAPRERGVDGERRVLDALDPRVDGVHHRQGERGDEHAGHVAAVRRRPRPPGCRYRGGRGCWSWGWRSWSFLSSGRRMPSRPTLAARRAPPHPQRAHTGTTPAAPGPRGARLARAPQRASDGLASDPWIRVRQPGDFAVVLRRLRESRSLTQEELAERAGLTAKAIGALERGERRRPYPHTVRSLADGLALDDDERPRSSPPSPAGMPCRAGPAPAARRAPAAAPARTATT